MFLEYINAVLNWCIIKISLWGKPSRVLFKEGEIWWCRIGMNVGAEIYGKGENFIRPVLIFKKFSESMFLGMPLTSKQREGSWYVAVSYGEKEGRVILNQIKAMDRGRLVKRIGVLNDGVSMRVYDAFWDLYRSQ
jgi:mRNA-degrading endonuclease toxin of MazEF toxin-antitoxin module